MASIRSTCRFIVLVSAVLVISDCGAIVGDQAIDAASTGSPRPRQSAIDDAQKSDGSVTCLTFGGNHYVTFDRQLITYLGTCKHLLVGTDSFQVYVRNAVDVSRPFSGTVVTSTIRYVEVALCNNVVRIEGDPASSAIVPVKVSLLWSGAPSFGYKVLRIPSNGTCYRLDYIGNSVQLETEDGTQIRFNGLSMASVRLPVKRSATPRGMCGNNNGNASDDLTASDGTFVGKQSASIEGAFIGNSYVVLDDEVLDTSRCPTPIDETPTHCSTSNGTANRCSLIVDVGGVFGRCIARVGHADAQMFFASCYYDACRLGESSICASLEVFASECSINGIHVTWRNVTNCRMRCPNGTIPSAANVPPCQATCEDPSAASDCLLSNGEKCQCPADKILFDGHCVSCCGCTDDQGNTHSSGNTWTDVDCMNRSCSAVTSHPVEASSCVSVISATSLCTEQQMCDNGTCTNPYPVFPQPDCSLGFTDGDYCPWTNWNRCIGGIQTRTRSCSCPSISCCGEYDPNDISTCMRVLKICGIDPEIFGLCPARRCTGHPIETRSC